MDARDRFQMLGLVGGGSEAAVYRAYDTVLGEPVALKFPIDAAGVERLKREARVARRLSHPNIAGIHELHEGAPLPFLSMPWLEGETLSARIGRRGALAGHAATHMFRKLASALATTHRMGIVHADIKPDNIMIVDRGDPVLIDFGSAREPGDPRAGELDGTPGFMAPAQPLVAPTADVFALGRTMAYALGLETDDEPWRRAPRPLRLVLRKCLAPAPSDRFCDGTAVLEALDREHRRQWFRRSVVVAAAASVAAVGYAALPIHETPVAVHARAADEAVPLWHRAQELSRAGRLGEAKAAYTEALRRFTVDDYRRPCLLEALALARRMNDRSREAELALELARVDARVATDR